MEFFTDNSTLLILAAFVISEGLSLIPSVKANSIFQVVAGLIKGLAAKKPYVPKA